VNPESVPASRARVRWGLPDVAIAWGAGFVGAALALPLYDQGVEIDRQPARFILATVLLQNLAIVLALIAISHWKGQRSLGRDFGLVWPFDRMKALAVAGWLGAGMGLSLLAAVLLRPIAEAADLDESAQEISQAIERGGTVGRVLMGLAVVLVAPPVEELLFRGALLRSLQRRWSAATAVFVSAFLFGAIHVAGDVGAGYVLPGLILLGLVSGYQAVKRGDLARSVLLHMGFNLVSAIALVVR
jgi:membrane protease YdiL (CAAX protease family)